MIEGLALTERTEDTENDESGKAHTHIGQGITAGADLDTPFYILSDG